MIQPLRLSTLRPQLCAAVACMMFAGVAGAASAAAAQEQQPQGFPLLADMPERPAAVSADVRENLRRYRAWVAELQAERRDMLHRLRQSRQQTEE